MRALVSPFLLNKGVRFSYLIVVVMGNRHGHWLCWMSTGRKNGIMLCEEHTHSVCCFLWPLLQSIEHHGLCMHHPCRVEVVSGLVGQDNFVPSRRFREDGLEDLKKLSTGGGRQIYSRRPRRGETNEAHKSVHLSPNKTVQILEAMWHALCFIYTFFFTGHFHGQTTARGGRCYLVLACD